MTNLDSNLTGRAITPLWIIALFVSLTEVILGIATTQTTGGVQIALTVFVIFFPLLIAGGFFLILWNKPYVFYPPKEFGDQTDVQKYVEAMQQNRTAQDENKLYSDIQRTIQTTLLSKDIIASLTTTVSANASQKVKDEVEIILKNAAEKTLEKIKEKSFLEVDTRPLIKEFGAILNMPYSEYPTIKDFLDVVFFHITIEVPPYTYGETWLLKDVESGKIYDDIGLKWAKRFGIKADVRSLKEVGILPGMKLEVIPFDQFLSKESVLELERQERLITR